MENVSNEWSRALDQFDPLDPEATARSAFSRHQKYLNDAIRRWEDHLVSLLEEQWTMIEAEANEDRKRYYEPGSALVEELVTRRMRLTPVLNALDGLRETFHEEFAAKYESRLRAYEQLGEKIDLDAALVWNSEQRAELEKKVDQLNALAQLGITVEIVGHELEALDAEVNRNLKRLPLQTRQLEAYQLAASAHEALVARLRFLSPLQFSGPRLRTTITGAAIAKYVGEFFERQFVASRIKFVATNAFKAISFKEYPSRVYPVFINLVNNSLYWLTFGQDREIRLDVVDDAVVVSDSGPGVDPDDMLHLFELFFTRRTNGRGVGLYLCKVNLGAGGHTIEYATTKKFQLLQPGANFVIRLKRG
jgi:signal transduction histidine kinase